MAKRFRVRRPSLRVSPKGKVSVTSPSVRLGGRRSGVNVSRRGVNATFGTRAGSFNTKRGCRMNLFVMVLAMLVLVVGFARLI